ncbi:aaa domain-containing [Holotrichia oblita]|uniref:Aaa domain-containing n=1 Tax=Holotrichia oblita TaxID=644536 RepID=A0ACB9TN94_HOLOL|nr:aaa domain-containing [Holotrichia oblita]
MWEPASKLEKEVCQNNQYITSINEDSFEPNVFISGAEYNEIRQHELSIEEDICHAKDISGNRIVDIKYILKWATTIQYNHAKICSTGTLILKKEQRFGLVSKFTFQCNLCERQYKYATEDPTKPNSTIINGAVWGTVASGSTYGHIKELLSVMDVPVMSAKYFYKIECNLNDVWKDALWQELHTAGEEERLVAIEKGHVIENVPWITVYLDDGWNKRSYGHSYNTASGVAVIIGRATRKVLYVGIRNKYCSICARADNINSEPQAHIC